MEDFFLLVSIESLLFLFSICIIVSDISMRSLFISCRFVASSSGGEGLFMSVR